MERNAFSDWINIPLFFIKFFSNVTIGVLFLYFSNIFKTLDKPEQAKGFRNAALIAILPIFATFIFSFFLGALFSPIIDSKHVPEIISSIALLLPGLLWVYFGCLLIPSCIFFIIWIIILTLINYCKGRYEKATAYLLCFFVALVAAYFWWINRGYGTFGKNWGW